MLIVLGQEICPYSCNVTCAICPFGVLKYSFAEANDYSCNYCTFLQVFHEVAYKARNRGDLLAGIDEFLDKVTVLPPGEWDPQIRLAPPEKVPSQNDRRITTDPKKEQTCKKEERNSRQPPVKWYKR